MQDEQEEEALPQMVAPAMIPQAPSETILKDSPSVHVENVSEPVIPMSFGSKPPTSLPQTRALAILPPQLRNQQQVEVAQQASHLGQL